MAAPIIDHNLLTLDYWQDRVSYEGKTVPSGTIGCEALDISDVLRENWHRKASFFGKSFRRLARTG